MTRICLIGNSHLAVFRRGWMALDPVPPGMSATFFGSWRDSLKMLEARDGKLVPTTSSVRQNIEATSDGISEVDPALYDIFVLSGLSASMKRSLRFYRFHRWFGQTQAPGTTLLRRSLAFETLKTEFAQTRLAELGQTLRLLTDKPIYAFAEPFWALRSRGAADGPGADGAGIAALFTESLTAALANSGVTFIPQPADTIAEDVYTADPFNVPDADRVLPKKKDLGDTDYAHMNGSYGTLCWRDLLERFAE